MTKLDEITIEMSQCDRQERIDLLLDFAKSLPPLPDRLAAHKDAAHRVEECQSPVYLFVELDGERVGLYADAPIEAPTVRGFVSMLLEGLEGATVEDILRVPNDLVDRSGLAEILGMLRVRGLSGVLRRIKSEVTRAAIARSAEGTSARAMPGRPADAPTEPVPTPPQRGINQPWQLS
jgi:cysteine desulfuration protein SufE